MSSTRTTLSPEELLAKLYVVDVFQPQGSLLCNSVTIFSLLNHGWLGFCFWPKWDFVRFPSVRVGRCKFG